MDKFFRETAISVVEVGENVVQDITSDPEGTARALAGDPTAIAKKSGEAARNFFGGIKSVVSSGFSQYANYKKSS